MLKLDMSLLSLITFRYRLSLHRRRSPVVDYGTLSRSTSRAARKKAPPLQLHRQGPAASFPRLPAEACQEEGKLGRSQLTSFIRSQAILESISPRQWCDEIGPTPFLEEKKFAFTCSSWKGRESFFRVPCPSFAPSFRFEKASISRITWG